MSSRRFTKSEYPDAAMDQAPGVGKRLTRRRLRPDARLVFVQKNTRIEGERRMAKFIAHMRSIAGALALALLLAMSVPVSGQQPSSVNPTADAVKEQQLLQQLKMIQGRGTIPDVKSYVIEHPVGQNWQEFHSVTLRWIGAIAILGMLLLLVIFYLWRGMVRLESGRSGRKI